MHIKLCTRCNTGKNVSEFHANKNNPDGFQKQCKVCRQRAYNNLTPEQKKERNLIQHYNMTWLEYLTKYTAQEGKCGCCSRPIALLSTTKNRIGAHVDHNHETNVNRDLLCHQCNIAVGMIKESVETAEALVLYLKRHQNTH